MNARVETDEATSHMVHTRRRKRRDKNAPWMLYLIPFYVIAADGLFVRRVQWTACSDRNQYRTSLIPSRSTPATNLERSHVMDLIFFHALDVRTRSLFEDMDR